MKQLIILIIVLISINLYSQTTFEQWLLQNQPPIIESYSKEQQDSINRENCLKFDKVIDEFDRSVTLTYQINSDVSVIKIISGSVSSYYLSIYIKENSIYTGLGVSIILCVSDTLTNTLNNKYKINKANQLVDCSYINNNFYTKSFIKLKVADLELLKKGEYMKYKLYISNGECSYDQERIKCLIKAK